MGGQESINQQNLPADFPADFDFFHLDNLGNTCFCNSVIQSILNSKYSEIFFRSFSSLAHNDKCIIGEEIKKSPLFQFLKIFETKHYENKNEHYFTPRDFLRSIYNETQQFIRGQQQDAHEFLLYIISSFDDTVKILNKINDKKMMPFFSEIFQGSRKSSFQCQSCNFEDDKEPEIFISLQVSLMPNSNLQDCVDELVFPENMTDEITCANCNTKTTAIIKSYIAKLPPVLIIELQRFKYDSHSLSMLKDNSFLPIQNEIHINSGTGPQIYKLSSIICHIGKTLHHGHYVSFIKAGNYWVLASDRQLSIQALDIFQNPQNQAMYTPYILIYEC